MSQLVSYSLNHHLAEKKAGVEWSKTYCQLGCSMKKKALIQSQGSLLLLKNHLYRFDQKEPIAERHNFKNRYHEKP